MLFRSRCSTSRAGASHTIVSGSALYRAADTGRHRASDGREQIPFGSCIFGGCRLHAGAVHHAPAHRAGAGTARLDRPIHPAHCPAVRVQQLHLFYFRVPKARRQIAGRLSKDDSGHCRNAQNLMISIEHLDDMLMGCGKTAEGYCKPAGKSV